jgi:hypothetical protein
MVINSFKNARFLSGFDNDQNGNMYDIMVEKRLNPKFDIEFKRDDNQIIALHKDKEYRFEKEAISLKAIAEATHIKPLLYVTKPQNLQKDYNDMLKTLNDGMKQTEKKSFKY